MKETTCVVIGNGPSLNDVPQELFKKYPSFGTNRIYKKLTPTYYVCTNPLVLKQFAMDISRLKCIKYLRDNPLNIRGIPKEFSYDPINRVYEGYTVTFVCLQLAYYLGFKTVLLVGVDHKYTFNGLPNEEKFIKGPDINHFDPDYFNGVYWHNPDLEKSRESYEMAKTAFESNGRRIVNLTEGSDLDVFEKGRVSDWI